jgi:hypothetical protein
MQNPQGDYFGNELYVEFSVSTQTCVGSGGTYICTILATDGWQQTPLVVQPNTNYSILYKSGTWTVSSDKLSHVGPNGYPPGQGWQNPESCLLVRPFVPHANLLSQVGDKTMVLRLALDGSNVLIDSGGNNYFTGPLSLRINEKDECLADNDGSIIVEIQEYPQHLPNPPTEDAEGEICGQFIRINESSENWPAFQPYGTNEVWIIDPEAFFYLEDVFQEGSNAQITDPVFGDDFAPAWGYARVRYLIDDYGTEIVSSCETSEGTAACVGADGEYSCTIDAKAGWHLTPLVLGPSDTVYFRYISGAWTTNKEKLEYVRPDRSDPPEAYVMSAECQWVLS